MDMSLRYSFKQYLYIPIYAYVYLYIYILLPNISETEWSTVQCLRFVQNA